MNEEIQEKNVEINRVQVWLLREVQQFPHNYNAFLQLYTTIIIIPHNYIPITYVRLTFNRKMFN